MQEYIEITPHTSLIAKTGKTGYTTPQALAEFVDNAIDARGRQDPVNIVIRIRRSKDEPLIEVEDDGLGMDRKELTAALVMARSAKSGRKIGRFGMGMKTAAATLGKRFVVVTKKKSMPNAIRTVYDENTFIDGGEWKLPIEDVKWSSDSDSGTIIQISELKVSSYGGIESNIASSLGRTFRHFLLQNACTIKVNRIQVEAMELSTMPGWRDEFDFDFMGKRVRGWIGLQPEHKSRDYGFDLIRHNRVMKECDKLLYGAHPSLGFIRGELFLDDWETNFSKTDFDRNSEEWKALMERLKETEFKRVAAQSRKMASSRAISDRVKAEAYGKAKLVEDVLRSTDFEDALAHITEAGIADLDYEQPLVLDTTELPGIRVDQERVRPTGKASGNPRGRPSAAPPKSQVDKAKRAQLAVAGLTVEHAFVQARSRDYAYKRWSLQEKDGRKILRVSTIENHPIFETHPSKSFWAMHNVAEAVAEYLEREASFGDIMAVKAKLLAEAGKKIMSEIERPKAKK